MMVEFLHRSEDRAGGILRFEGEETIHWSAIQNRGKWYILIHNDIKDDSKLSLKCILNMIQNSLKYKKAA